MIVYGNNGGCSNIFKHENRYKGWGFAADDSIRELAVEQVTSLKQPRRRKSGNKLTSENINFLKSLGFKVKSV